MKEDNETIISHDPRTIPYHTRGKNEKHRGSHSIAGFRSLSSEASLNNARGSINAYISDFQSRASPLKPETLPKPETDTSAPPQPVRPIRPIALLDVPLFLLRVLMASYTDV